MKTPKANGTMVAGDWIPAPYRGMVRGSFAGMAVCEMPTPLGPQGRGSYAIISGS